MKLLLTILACLVAASAGAQTVKSLSYNTTNGQVVYSGTNRLTFTNSLLVASQTGSVLSVGTTNVQIRRDPGSGSLIFTANGNTNTFEFLPSGTLRLSGPLSFDATTNALGYAATTRTNLGGTTVGNALFTAATTSAARVALGGTIVGENIFTVPIQYQELFLRINADNTVSSLSPAATRTNLGLGATNNVTFSNITASGTLAATGNVTLSGVNNTATAQTADSASSLMTRDLSDERYTTSIWLTQFSDNQTITNGGFQLLGPGRFNSWSVGMGASVPSGFTEFRVVLGFGWMQNPATNSTNFPVFVYFQNKNALNSTTKEAEHGTAFSRTDLYPTNAASTGLAGTLTRVAVFNTTNTVYSFISDWVTIPNTWQSNASSNGFYHIIGAAIANNTGGSLTDGYNANHPAIGLIEFRK